MKNIIKKISAIAMCGVLTIGSVLMTGAVSEDENLMTMNLKHRR